MIFFVKIYHVKFRLLNGSLLWFQACLIGVAVPDPDTFPKFAKKTLGITGTMESLAANPVSDCDQ